MKQCLLSVALAGSVVLSRVAFAATVIATIEVPGNQVWYTASTMTPQTLLANTIFNYSSYQNSGLPVSMTRQNLSGGRLLFTITVRNVPAGVQCFTNARNNYTGVLRSSNRVTISNPNATYFLNRIYF
jgi:hypothetical protein